MKRYLLAILFVMLITSSAHALSDSTYKKMLKNPDFAKADKALNQAWKDAKNSLDSDSFNSLKKEQTQWVKRGRDDEVRPLLRDMSRTEAYAVITAKRAEYINQYVSRLTGGAVDEEYEDFDIMDDEDVDVPETPVKSLKASKAPKVSESNNDVSETPENDLPDDLPQDVPDMNDVPQDSDSKNDSKSESKNTAIDSQAKASEILSERLIDMSKIMPNETLEYSGQTQIDGQDCWEFSSQFNFSETGRYLISPNGKIYEFDNSQEKFITVK